MMTAALFAISIFISSIHWFFGQIMLDYILKKPLFLKHCNKEMFPDISTCIKPPLGNKVNMAYISHISD